MNQDLDIRLKQYMRDHLMGMMIEEIKKARAFGWVPAIVIKDTELEQFIDRMWESIVLSDYQRQKKEKFDNELKQ